MSLAAKAIQFNVSKKAAQLVKVISFFSTQIEERKFQVNFLREKFEANLKICEEKYLKQMDELREKTGPITNECYSKINAEYATRFRNIVDDYEKFVDNQKLEIGEISDETMHEVTILVAEIMNISKSLLNSQSIFGNSTFQANQKIDTELKSDRYKKEIENLEKESREKYEKYEKESQQKLNDLEEKHKKELLEVRKSFSGNTTEFDRFNMFLADAKSETMKKKTQHNELNNEYKDLKNTNVFKEMREKANTEINKLKNLMHEIGTKTNKAKENIEKEKENNTKEEEKAKEELSALKASLEFKLNKFKNEINELLTKLENEFLQKTEQSRKKLSEMNKEFEELIKQQTEEMNNFKNKLEENEQETRRNLSSKEKLIDETIKYHKMEEDKLEREKTSVTAKNERELINTKTNMKSALDNARSRYDLILSQMRVDMEKLMGKDKQQIIEARNELELAKKRKEEAAKNKEQRLLKYQEETNKLEKTNTAFNENMRNELQNKLNNEFHDKQVDADGRINNTLDQNKKSKEEKIDELKKKYDETMNQMREKGFDHSQYDEELKNFKTEYDQQQEKLNSIHPPTNKNFALLDEKITKITNDIGLTLKANQKEREDLIDHYNNEIDNENERYRRTLSRNSSGRNREQVKQSLTNSIEQTKKEKQEEQERLMKILQQLNQQFLNDMVKCDEGKIAADNKENINKLENELAAEMQKKQMQISEANKQKENEVNKSKFRYESLKCTIESRKAEANQELMDENTKFQELLNKVNGELESLVNKNKEIEATATRNHNNTMEQENASFKYHSEQVKAQIQVDRDALDQKAKDSKSVIKQKMELDEKELNKYKKNRENMNKQMISDWNALNEFYDEKISVLEKKLQDVIDNYNSRPGRQCDIDEIEKLTVKLQIITAELKRNAKDLVEYRKLMVVREKEYNKKFGRQPNIGVLAFG